ncbi:hypothetical protein B0T17DRAFT_587165 [Bombardia bombarda]|uniref:Uncharacterized protein n=1 Tax=Bombardia bombarda TaxID=252184 RepID=A0AA39XKR3_9PEZI|nr:hypothetical protein B0T17DRAFT_587165 [Bombardia bombarda]
MSLASPTSLQVGGGQPVPRVAEPLDSEPGTGDTTPRTAADVDEKDKEKEKKAKKRSLFGFGKKKTAAATDEPAKSSSAAQQQAQSRPANNAANSSSNTTSSLATRRTTTAASPIQTEYPHYLPSSPGRALASSPRLTSPAGSQIFERDVQESAAVLPNSPAIPSHIQTENYIPPVLDASSEAITDDHLDPDSVEIITHTSHQPASVTVTGATNNNNSTNLSSLEGSWADELAAFTSNNDGGLDSASNYGSLDTTDVRRLSFISFADVVQSEQATHGGGGGGGRDSMYLAGLTSLSSVAGINNRSPSPIRSPVSSASGLGTGSPPTSKSGSVKGFELSPTRKPLGSPTGLHHGSGSPTVSGELAIETMSQALRRTGSGDLSGVRSLPTSPI